MSVRTDKVNLIVTVGANQAKNELNELRRNSAEINHQLKGMKKGTEEYKAASLRLSEVNSKIKDLKNEIGLTALNQKELVKSIQVLTSQRNSLTPFTEEWKKINNEIQKYSDRLKEVRTGSAAIKPPTAAKENGLTSFGVGLASFAGNLLANAADKLRELVGLAFQSALQLEGVKIAFDKLDSPGLLDNLRRATKGTVTDLELMKKAVQANNFQIPLETLGTLLEFASRRARDTGENVDYLVDSIVTGIARKSPMILDNLGINIVRIQNELKKTGDFAQAAMNVVNEEMEKAGPTVDTMADKVDRLKTNFSNIFTTSASGFLQALVTITEKMEFYFDTSSAIAKHATQEIAKQNEAFRRRELLQLEDYRKQYAKTDEKGREKIIELVKAEIKTTEELYLSAYMNGNKSLAANFKTKISMYSDFVDTLKKGIPNNKETIGGIEAELSVLTEQLKKLTINSPEFIKTKREIDQLNEKLQSINKKTTSTDDIKKARKDYADLIKEIDRMLKMADGNKITKIIEDANKKAEELTTRLKQDVLGGNLTREDLQNGMKKIEELRGSLIKEGIKKLNDSAKEMEAKLVIPVVPELEENNSEAKKQIENAINRYMIGLRDNAAKAQRIFISTRGFDIERLRKHKEMLDAMKALELENTELTEEEKLLIEEEYRQMRIDAQQSFIDALEKLGNDVIAEWRKINTIISNLERQRLQREERDAERSKNKLQKQLDNKLISQEQYNLKVAQIEEEADAKRRKIAREQAKREKAINVFQATLSGIAAVAKAAASAFPPFNLPAIIAESIRSALLVAAAATTSLPELRRGKWFKSGAKHEQGGIPVEIEVGEAVMTSNTMLDPNQYTVSGTPAQITSALNSLGGGEAWASGAVVQQTPWIRNAAPSINPNMPRIMTQNNSPVNEAQQNNVVNVDLQGLVNEMQEFRRDVNNWARNIKADIIIEEFREKESIYDAARDASRILPA